MTLNTFILIFLIIPLISSSSSMNRVKSLKLELTNETDSLQWELDLAEMAGYALEANALIKFEVNTTEPITFSLNKCMDMILTKDRSFQTVTLFFGIPWLQYFVKDSTEKCLHGYSELTLEMHFGSKNTSGFVEFSEVVFAPSHLKELQPSIVPIGGHGQVVQTFSMGTLIKNAMFQRNTTTLVAIYNYTDVDPIFVGFGKCGVQPSTFDFVGGRPFLIRGELLDHLYRLSTLYCHQDPYEYTLEVSISAPTAPLDGAIAFELLAYQTPNEAWGYIKALITILAIIVAVALIKIALSMKNEPVENKKIGEDNELMAREPETEMVEFHRIEE
ncbi:hypothetical protein CRE_01388 [Caenorhabditis remanei]|uniref:Uncharacterized protein n=1 Tax=Caenorhabditis remanei TaxID=31234 RepID=E3NG01_CAERE|nr:hypothetical protein CRE_01388 [Caenorhabditis remanei]